MIAHALLMLQHNNYKGMSPSVPDDLHFPDSRTRALSSAVLIKSVSNHGGE
jgi:hypothetical protein